MQKHYIENLFYIVKLVGGKFVIVEDGKPKAVLMDYSEFEKLASPAIERNLVEKMSKIEEINQNISNAQAQDLREEVISEDVIVSDEPIVEPIDH